MSLKLAAQYKIATAIKEIAEAMKIDTDLIDTSAALDWSAEALRQIAQQIKDNGGFVGKLPIHLCVEGEYNPETGKPTITTPEEDIFYLVPTGDSLGDDQFKAWVYSEGRWERWENIDIEIPQSDWAQTDPTAIDYIKNKPSTASGVSF